LKAAAEAPVASPQPADSTSASSEVAADITKV
jgi:hypothetical protein